MAGNQGFAGTSDSLRERLDRLDSLSRLLDITF